MTDWWLGLPAAAATLDCGGETHRLRWSDGAMHALDHDDVDGERALAALGGEPCPCVDLLDRWERHASDLRVLVLARRGPADLLSPADASALPRRRRGSAASINAGPGPAAGPWASTRPAPFAMSSMSSMSMTVAARTPSGRGGRRSAPAGDELIGLLGLGGGLPDRLQATVIATWTERIARRDRGATPDPDGPPDADAPPDPDAPPAAGTPPDPDAPPTAGTPPAGGTPPDPDAPPDARAAPRLTAAVHGRLTESLRSWLGQAGVELELELVAATAPRSLTRIGPTRLHAQLPFAWLGDVWCRGLASVFGRFCVAASTTDGREWTLSTLGPELGPAETITVVLRAPGEQRTLR